MKKIIIKLITLITALILCMASFSGCSLVSVDNQKDMDQVVATITTGSGAPTEKIYKKDLVVMYMNYGYYYVQNNGYTQKQAFELIMNNLVNNVILVQTAEKEYAAKNNITEDIYNVDKYLNEEEKAKATYNTNKAFNDLIESYKKKEDEEDKKETEAIEGEERAVPTDAKNFEDEHEGFDNFLDFYNDYNTKEESYLNKGIITGFDDELKTTDVVIKKAYNKLLKALDTNGLLGDDFDFEKDSIYETEYYKKNLRSEKETILTTNYQEKLTLDIMKEVSYDDIAARYAEMYKAQYESFDASISDYEKALDSASKSNPVIYHPVNGYSYVYNLLLGVDEYQKAEIEAINAKTTLSVAEKQAARELILTGVTAKDLRSSWLTSGYDFDAKTKTFTGDYSFATEGNRLPFQGEFVLTNEDEKNNDDGTPNEDYKEAYKATSLKKYSLNEFVKFMDSYLGLANTTDVNEKDYYKAVKNNAKPTEYDEKVTDMLFAFSTDGGSLNTYNGYLVKPKVDISGSETYVKEFAEAARLVTNETAGYGKGSYIIVGTDFGYHIILNSETIKAKSGYATLESYLNSLGEEKKIGETTYATWEEYYNAMLENIDEFKDSKFYLYTLQQAYVKNTLSTRLTQKQTAIINQYKVLNDKDVYEKFNEDYVKLYTERYKEFLKEEKAPNSQNAQ